MTSRKHIRNLYGKPLPLQLWILLPELMPEVVGGEILATGRKPPQVLIYFTTPKLLSALALPTRLLGGLFTQYSWGHRGNMPGRAACLLQWTIVGVIFLC
jgi:hypothetical protein